MKLCPSPSHIGSQILWVLACVLFSSPTRATTVNLFDHDWQPSSNLSCSYNEDNFDFIWSRCDMAAHLESDSKYSVRISRLALEGALFTPPDTTSTERDDGLGAALFYKRQWTPVLDFSLGAGVLDFEQAESAAELEATMNYALLGGSAGFSYAHGPLFSLSPALEGHFEGIDYDSYTVSDWRPWSDQVVTYMQFTWARLTDQNDHKSMYWSYDYLPLPMRPMSVQLSGYGASFTNRTDEYYSPERDLSLTLSWLNEHDLGHRSALDYQLGTGRAWSRALGSNEPATIYQGRVGYQYQAEAWQISLSLFGSSSNRNGAVYRTKGGQIQFELEI